MGNWTYDLDIDSQFRTVFSADNDCRSPKAPQCTADFHSQFVFGMDISGMDHLIGVVLYGAGSRPKLACEIKGQSPKFLWALKVEQVGSLCQMLRRGKTGHGSGRTAKR